MTRAAGPVRAELPLVRCDRDPVLTLADLDALDDAELMEGYWDGRENAPAPGANRSRAYWHGWRNGQVDGHHAEPDGAMRELARAYLSRPGSPVTITAGPGETGEGRDGS